MLPVFLRAGMRSQPLQVKKKNITGGVNEYIFSKLLAQADYNFDNKYFFVGSIVNDYSSRFGSNNPSANFFQLGASWIITNEKFIEYAGQLDLLKLRASYGTTGNAGVRRLCSHGSLFHFAGSQLCQCARRLS